MLGLGMMLGEGRPAFTVELNNNRTQWSVLADAPQLSVGGPITLTLIVGPNINITSNDTLAPAISLAGLWDGSWVYLINQGTIQGAAGASPKASSGFGVYAGWNGRIFITNGSGFINAGMCSDGIGYAVYSPLVLGQPMAILSWVSGSSRITGTVYP